MHPKKNNYIFIDTEENGQSKWNPSERETNESLMLEARQ